MKTEVENKLVVRMLEQFTITYGGRELSLGKTSMSKIMELFQILMINIRNGVPKIKIQQSLYEWESVNNRNRSLNNLIYRLKQQMSDEGIVQEEYISIKNGICKWVSEVPVEVDVDQFEDAVARAEYLHGDEKQELLMQAFSLYRGELLPDMSKTSWVIEKRLQLKKVYRSCILQLEELLEEKQEYETLFGIYTKAAELYPYDEWQVGQINVLQKMERYEEAYAIYQKTVKEYFDELGIPPSQKMLDMIHDMGTSLLNQESHLDDIKEVLEEDAERRGAYYCSYPSFEDIYRLIARTVERSGQSIFLMMCSVRYLDFNGRKSPNAEEALYESIFTTIRKGDIFTRYSKQQFLILLMGAQKENCDMIFERIRKKFKRKNRNTNCDLEFNVSEILDIPDSPVQIKFKNNTVKWN